MAIVIGVIKYRISLRVVGIMCPFVPPFRESIDASRPVTSLTGAGRDKVDSLKGRLREPPAEGIRGKDRESVTA